MLKSPGPTEILTARLYNTLIGYHPIILIRVYGLASIHQLYFAWLTVKFYSQFLINVEAATIAIFATSGYAVFCGAKSSLEI